MIGFCNVERSLLQFFIRQIDLSVESVKKNQGDVGWKTVVEKSSRGKIGWKRGREEGEEKMAKLKKSEEER